jgi:hypothetical protein
MIIEIIRADTIPGTSGTSLNFHPKKSKIFCTAGILPSLDTISKIVLLKNPGQPFTRTKLSGYKGSVPITA